MVTNYYKIYPISELNRIDWNKFTHDPDTCRKSIDGTEFLAKFKEKPHANTITLNGEEVLELMQTPKWRTIEDDEATFE